MSNVVQFPSQDSFLIAVATDEDTGEEIILLDQIFGGERTEVGEFSSMFQVIAAIDAIMGIDRTGDSAAGSNDPRGAA